MAIVSLHHEPVDSSITTTYRMVDPPSAKTPTTVLEVPDLPTNAAADEQDTAAPPAETENQTPLLETSMENTNDLDIDNTLPQESTEPPVLDNQVTQSQGLEADATQATQTEQQHTMTPEQMQAQHAQYIALMPHGHQPYYHDPMLHPTAQYQHPQASFMGQVPNPPGTKAKRKRASPHQLALLNQIFEYTFFPSTELRNAIGKELGMAPRTVQIWFQNRRQSWRAQKSRDGTDDQPKSNDNERGGWEVLRSFQARRANGEIQEYEYMAMPAAGAAGLGIDPRTGQPIEGFSMTLPQYGHHHLIPAALSSNDQFNASMQQLPGLLPHAPQLNFAKQQQQQNGHPVAAAAAYQPDASSLAAPEEVAATADGALAELDPRLDKD